MTNGMSLEVQVANSARVWRESSHGADIAANEFRDRKFAEALRQPEGRPGVELPVRQERVKPPSPTPS